MIIKPTITRLINQNESKKAAIKTQFHMEHFGETMLFVHLSSRLYIILYYVSTEFFLFQVFGCNIFDILDTDIEKSLAEFLLHIVGDVHGEVT